MRLIAPMAIVKEGRITEFNRVKDRSRVIKRYDNDFPKTKKKFFSSLFHLFSPPCVSIVIERKRGGGLLYRRADGVSLVLSLPPFMPRCFPTLESGSRLDTFFSIANGESTISHGAHNGGARQQSLS